MNDDANLRRPRWLPRLPVDGWGRGTLALLALALVTVLATFSDYGSTWDERFQAELGRDVVEWFATGGADPRAVGGGSAGNLHLYGGLFEAAAELAGRALPFHPFESRHLLNALVGLAGLLGVVQLARRLGGWRAAFFAGLLLATTPPWWGHAFSNSKDIPFAAAYPWFLLALLRAGDDLPRPGLRRVLAAGAALGAGLAVRPGGLVVLVPLAAGIVGARVLPVARAAAGQRLGALASAGARLVAVLGIGWVGMLAFWPYGILHPVQGTALAVEAARTFRWEGLVRYAGGWHLSTDLPRGYAPTWFLATLPESWIAVLAASLLAGAFAWRRGRRGPLLEGRWLDPALVAVAALGPILAAVVARPVLYDGVRHLLFVLPALAALAGWGLSAAVAALPRRVGRGAVAATAALAALAVADAVRLHPYQYLYFNRLVAGGMRQASRDFELDYWGATGREAMEWVAANVPPRRRPITVETTADPTVASLWVPPVARDAFEFEPPGPPDLRLATTRWLQNRSTGRVLHVVARMGVPLLYVIESLPGGGPLVLEGGDRAVALPDGAGWAGVPWVERGGTGAVFVIDRVFGPPGQVEARLTTPRSGSVKGLEELRAEVLDLGRTLPGLAEATAAPMPVAGPDAKGWVLASGEAGPRDGAPSVAVAAARVGDSAVVMVARVYGEPGGAGPLVTEWIRGARPAVGAERRPP